MALTRTRWPAVTEITEIKDRGRTTTRDGTEIFYAWDGQAVFAAAHGHRAGRARGQ